MSSKIKNYLWLVCTFILSIQWIVLHYSHVHTGIIGDALFPGICIFAAAFILSWAADLSQYYIPQSLALIFLALIAVLPEYAVDMYFAWTAGKNPEYISYAAANMTGGNRLLVGVGWPLISIVFWLKTKKTVIELTKENRREIITLLIATIYSFTIPLKGSLTLADTAILLTIFVVYLVLASRAEHVEPEPEEGPVELLSRLPHVLRGILTLFFFVFAGFCIYISAEPFSEGLLHIGAKTGIDKFILVQWIAPLASEAPELIVALIFVLNQHPEAGLRTVISSKINQWTLLVGMLPLVYNLSLGKIQPMVLDFRQIEEILLTAAQSLFALVILIKLRFKIIDAILLLVLFLTQLFIPSPTIRFIYSGIYILLAILFFLFRKK